jgi:hypothetical protein
VFTTKAIINIVNVRKINATKDDMIHPTLVPLNHPKHPFDLKQLLQFERYSNGSSELQPANTVRYVNENGQKMRAKTRSDHSEMAYLSGCKIKNQESG